MTQTARSTPKPHRSMMPAFSIIKLLDMGAGVHPSWPKDKQRKTRLLFLLILLQTPVFAMIIPAPTESSGGILSAVWQPGLIILSALALFAVRLSPSAESLGIAYGLGVVLCVGLGPLMHGGIDNPTLVILILVPLLMGLVSGATASALGALAVLTLYFSVFYSSYVHHGDVSVSSIAFLSYASVGTLLCGILVSYFEQMRHDESAALSKDNARVRTMAMTDPLTKRLNRRAFQFRIERMTMQSGSGAQPALCILDLDSFKQINDTYGHDVGDQVLIEFSRRVKAVIGPNREVYRLGGDEFAILCADEPSLSEMEVLAQNVTALTAESIETNSASIEFDVSIGVALSDGSAASIQGLYQQADTAAFVAKEKPHSCYIVFDTMLDSQANRKFEVERALKAAIQYRSISVAFQPQIDLRTGETLGYEALARWSDPVLGQISPGEFIEIAEETALIQVLDRLIIFKAVQSAGTWLGKNQRVSVNASARSLNSSDFAEFVLAQIKRHGLETTQVELEITETALIENWEKSKRTVENLRAKGVKIVLDDFGVGYSSLSYLVEFPVQKIKFDRSFLLKATSASNAMVMESIVGLANKMDVELVAEGIETKDQIDLLMQIGCFTGQGYLLGKPKLAAKMERRPVGRRTAA